MRFYRISASSSSSQPNHHSFLPLPPTTNVWCHANPASCKRFGWTVRRARTLLQPVVLCYAVTMAILMISSTIPQFRRGVLALIRTNPSSRAFSTIDPSKSVYVGTKKAPEVRCRLIGWHVRDVGEKTFPSMCWTQSACHMNVGIWGNLFYCLYPLWIWRSKLDAYIGRSRNEGSFIKIMGTC